MSIKFGEKDIDVITNTTIKPVPQMVPEPSQQQAQSENSCDPSYPDLCIPPYPPDFLGTFDTNCKLVKVLPIAAYFRTISQHHYSRLFCLIIDAQKSISLPFISANVCELSLNA